MKLKTLPILFILCFCSLISFCQTVKTDAKLLTEADSAILHKVYDVTRAYNMHRDIINSKPNKSTTVNGHALTSNVTVTKSDVGLGNVDNTSDASKPVSTAQQTALDGKQNLDSDLTAIAGLSPSNNDIIQRKAGVWTNRTLAQILADLLPGNGTTANGSSIDIGGTLTANTIFNGDGNNFEVGQSGDEVFNFRVYASNQVSIAAPGAGVNISSGTAGLAIGTSSGTQVSHGSNQLLVHTTNGSTFTGPVSIATAPSNDDALTQLLVRDGTTGSVKYRSASSITGTGTPTTRNINTTSPLSGGGDLSADRTISIANAAADGATKGAASFTANDFDASSGNISIDYTNGQAGSPSVKGFVKLYTSTGSSTDGAMDQNSASTEFIKTQGISLIKNNIIIKGDSSFSIGGRYNDGTGFQNGIKGAISIRSKLHADLVAAHDDYLGGDSHFAVIAMDVDTIVGERNSSVYMSGADMTQSGGMSLSLSGETGQVANQFSVSLNDLLNNGSASFQLSPIAGTPGTGLGNYIAYNSNTGTSHSSTLSQDDGGFTLKSSDGVIIAGNSGTNNKTLIITSPATNDDPTEIIYQNRITTTGSSVTTLHTVATTTDNSILITGLVLARRTGGSAGTAGDGAGYRFEGVFKNVGGTLTQLGATITAIGESQAGWDVTLVISGANIQIRVTGATNNNITWHLDEVKISQLGS